ncbi:MAG: AAA family ATPase, partial [Gemmatimonadota bacterium]
MSQNDGGGVEGEAVEVWGNRFRFIDHGDLASLPPMAWAVENAIPAHGYTLLVGDPKTGKSYLAMDLAGCVARGTRWFGRAVRQGPVAYIALEGREGMRSRLDPWEAHWGPIPADGIRFLAPGEKPNFAKLEDVQEIARAIRTQHAALPALVILDTLGAATPGTDMNTDGAATVMEHLKYLAENVGAPVLVVHHTTKNGSGRSGKGSVHIDASAEGFLFTRREASGFAFQSGRQRWCEDSEWTRVHLEETEDGPVLKSALRQHDAPRISPRARQAFLALPAGGLKCREWERASGLAHSTFGRIRQELVDDGQVTKDGDLYRPTGSTGSKPGPLVPMDTAA